jgi:2-iminobutanoate/2-iminopropanoate deaminase
MAKSNRRAFLTKGPAAVAVAAAAAAAAPAVVRAKGKAPKAETGNAEAAEAAGQAAAEKPVKKVLWNNGKRPEKQALFSPEVLKVNVYLNDLKDYAGMNEMFLGRFGLDPGVRTTIAAAGGIPGNSLVEIDCIAYI